MKETIGNYNDRKPQKFAISEKRVAGGEFS
jgi:hypothetical protein